MKSALETLKRAVNALRDFLIVSGSCLVSRQLLSSTATAATKVVGH